MSICLAIGRMAKIITVPFARTTASSRRHTHRVAVCCLVPIVCTMFAGRAFAQQKPALQAAGTVFGTVKDPSRAVIAGAVVTLESAGSTQPQRTTVTDEGGEFRFSPVAEGAYKLTITASGFAVWTAEGVAPTFEENPVPISAVLRLAPTSTVVNVSLPPHELAAQQVKAEEKQRVLGVFPNFFVTYEPNAAGRPSSIPCRFCSAVSAQESSKRETATRNTAKV